jgi:hypothetical protein
MAPTHSTGTWSIFSAVSLLGHSSVRALAGCTALAAILEHQVDDLTAEKLKASHNMGASNNAGVKLPPLKGRRLPRMGLSEAEIMHALQGFCDHVAEQVPGGGHGHSEKLALDCRDLLSNEVVETLEEHIFSEGSRRLRLALCVEATGLCSSHNVIDSGEL